MTDFKGNKINQSNVDKVLNNILLHKVSRIELYNKLEENNKKKVIERLKESKNALNTSIQKGTGNREEYINKLNTINDFFKNIFYDDNKKTDQQFFFVKLNDLRRKDQDAAAASRSNSRTAAKKNKPSNAPIAASRAPQPRPPVSIAASRAPQPPVAIAASQAPQPQPPVSIAASQAPQPPIPDAANEESSAPQPQPQISDAANEESMSQPIPAAIAASGAPPIKYYKKLELPVELNNKDYRNKIVAEMAKNNFPINYKSFKKYSTSNIDPKTVQCIVFWKNNKQSDGEKNVFNRCCFKNTHIGLKKNNYIDNIPVLETDLLFPESKQQNIIIEKTNRKNIILKDIPNYFTICTKHFKEFLGVQMKYSKSKKKITMTAAKEFKINNFVCGNDFLDISQFLPYYETDNEFANVIVDTEDRTKIIAKKDIQIGKELILFLPNLINEQNRKDRF